CRRTATSIVPINASRMNTWHADCSNARSHTIRRGSPMKAPFAPLFAVAALALAPLVLHAQEPAPPAPPPAQPSPEVGEQLAAEVSDEDLETFADIYVGLEETLTQYEQELAAAGSEEEAQETQTKMQKDALDKIAEHGWTPDQYNRVAQAVNADPTIREKAVALIEERS